MKTRHTIAWLDSVPFLSCQIDSCKWQAAARVRYKNLCSVHLKEFLARDEESA